jgi:HEAT repeat protein
MKTYLVITFAAVLMFALMLNISANPAPKNTESSNKEAESSLLKNLESKNFDTRINTAYSLGELKSSKAVIPLLKILHDEKSEDLRIVAALSLIKIGNGIGVYQVKQAAIYDDSPRVRRMCSIFYNAYIHDKVEN